LSLTCPSAWARFRPVAARLAFSRRFQGASSSSGSGAAAAGCAAGSGIAGTGTLAVAAGAGAAAAGSGGGAVTGAAGASVAAAAPHAAARSAPLQPVAPAFRGRGAAGGRGSGTAGASGVRPHSRRRRPGGPRIVETSFSCSFSPSDDDDPLLSRGTGRRFATGRRAGFAPGRRMDGSFGPPGFGPPGRIDGKARRSGMSGLSGTQRSASGLSGMTLCMLVLSRACACAK